MSLKKKGNYWYGTDVEDTRTEIIRYSNLNGYPAVRFSKSICACCGNQLFRLETDEIEGVARRSCTKCGTMKFMGDSEEYANDANLTSHICDCEAKEFELTSGVTLYQSSNDMHWYYIGCFCPKCQLVGVFADWKCEAGDAETFLANV